MTEPIKLPLRDAIIEGMGWRDIKGYIAKDDDLICRIERVVEQATADLRAQIAQLLQEAAERRKQHMEVNRKWTAFEAEANQRAEKAEAELAEKSDEIARLTTLRPVSEWKEGDVVFWELYGPAGYARWRHSDAFHASHWTPLPDVKEPKP